ncbi:MAG: N5-glutamine methyltransferase family protein [Candidatus Acidiferrales bacterium]
MTPSMDIRAALKDAMARLREVDVPSHTLAAEVLLMHVLACDRAWLYTHPEQLLELSAIERYFAFIARRAAGEPTQYLTGKQEFWGLEFEVTPAVLIPRPETEHLIEVALEFLGPRGLKIRLDTGAPSDSLRIADVGTGSGCLAVALAWELPHAKVFATDISPAALEVARQNAARIGVADRVHFVECDLLNGFSRDSRVTKSHLTNGLASGRGFSRAERRPISGVSTSEARAIIHQGIYEADPSPESSPFDLIVSNPPYVAREDANTLPREVREYEPHAALFGGPTGADIYPRLIEQAGALLRDEGMLAVELGYNSLDRVRAIFDAQSGWTNHRVTNDLAGIPRVFSAQRAA